MPPPLLNRVKPHLFHTHAFLLFVVSCLCLFFIGFIGLLRGKRRQSLTFDLENFCSDMRTERVDSISVVWIFNLSFIAMLVSVFIIKFALPSFNMYKDAGVIVEKYSIRREHKDSPTITFCAVNENYMGWKDDSIVLEDLYEPWRKVCNNATTVEAAITCISTKTFNLTETINSHPDPTGSTLDMDKEVWTNYVTSYLLGLLFKLGGTSLAVPGALLSNTFFDSNITSKIQNGHQGPKNGRWGLERGLPLGFHTFP